MAGRYPDDGNVGRKRPASGVSIQLGGPTIVYVTLCTDGRKQWLANPTVHEHLRATWQEAQAWLVGYYVIMPDHIHYFCAPRDLNFTLEGWMTYWERQYKRRSKNLAHRWQPHPWHTRLRRSESYQDKWAYVRENPMRKGLVQRPEEWPYQGMMNVLQW